MAIIYTYPKEASVDSNSKVLGTVSGGIKTVSYAIGDIASYVVEGAGVMTLAGNETITGDKAFEGGVVFNGTVGISSFPDGIIYKSSDVVGSIAGTADQFVKADGSVDTNVYALESSVPEAADYVNTTLAQTIGGVKTFSENIQIAEGSRIRFEGTHLAMIKSSNLLSDTRTLTIPDESGVIALKSNIPDNTAYVDLTTAQTIAGNKTFLHDVNMMDSVRIDSDEIQNGAGGVIFLPTGNADHHLATMLDLPTDYVNLVSNQTIEGEKVFEDTVSLNGPAYFGDTTTMVGPTSISDLTIKHNPSNDGKVSINFLGQDGYGELLSIDDQDLVMYFAKEKYILQGGTGAEPRRIALEEDVPTDYVSLTGNQSISGVKTFQDILMASDEITTTGGGSLQLPTGILDYTVTSIVEAPLSSSSYGEVGTIAYDDDYLYVCNQPNEWVRIPFEEW